MNKIELYRQDELSGLIRYRMLRRVILLILAALVISICVFLCFRVSARNARTLEIVVILISVISGWVLITLRYEWLVLSKREERHVKHIFAGPREEHCGQVSSISEPLRIPGSICIRNLILKEEGETRILHVNADKFDQIRELLRKSEEGEDGLTEDPAQEVTVMTVHNFVVGLEVERC